MDKIGMIYEKRKKYVIVAELILCIVIAMLICTQKKVVQDIVPTQMSLSMGKILEGDVAYIDEKYEYGGPFLEVDTYEFPKGIYKISVLYETDYNDNGLVITANNTNYGVMNTDISSDTRPIAFKSYNNECSVNAWLQEESSLHIQMRFCGAGYISVKSIIVEKTPSFTPLFLIVFALITFHVWHYEQKNFSEKELERRRFIRASLLFITIVASVPMMVDYLIQGTDMAFHLYRIQGIADGLCAGQFPVKIQPNWWDEYGYGVSLFYGDLFLYFPAILMLLGYSLQTTYKVYIVVIHLLTAWISYKCFVKIVKEDTTAILGALIYTLNIYRLMDIYMRGAVGEFTALTFLPLIVLGIYNIKEDGWIYLTLGMTGCIQSHILMCEMLSVFLILFCVIFLKWILQKRVLINLCKSIACTILWNLWFIVPLLNIYSGNYRVKSGHGFNEMIQERGAFPAELFKLFINGFVIDMPAASGISGEMGHSVGMAIGLGGAVSIAVIYIYRTKIQCIYDKELCYRPIILTCILSTFFALIAMWLSTNIFPYDRISGLSDLCRSLVTHIQFPWRFLGFVALFGTLTIICGFYLWQKICNEQIYIIKIVVLLMCILTLIATSSFYHEMLSKPTVITRSHNFETIHESMNQIEYLIDGTQVDGLEQQVITENALVSVQDVERKDTTFKMYCSNENVQESYIEVPLFFYPCYRAIDQETGNVLTVDYGTNNNIRIILPAKYSGTLVLRVRERMVWRATEIVSLVSFVIVMLYINRKNKQKCN